MDVFFSPLACSMAARIVIDEAGADARFVEVDPKTKQVLADGSDFRGIYPLGLVPTLRLDDGSLLTENAAILQYLAELHPAAGLVPPPGPQRARLQQWLCFVGTELHKALFVPLLDRKAPEAVKTYALEKGRSRLAYLEAHLEDRAFLLDRFSVADAYLATVLNWSVATPMLDLKDYPAVDAYLTRMRQRPSVARALGTEMPLFQAEVARHRAA
jgi:glutathione S-transferase